MPHLRQGARSMADVDVHAVQNSRRLSGVVCLSHVLCERGLHLQRREAEPLSARHCRASPVFWESLLPMLTLSSTEYPFAS